MRRVVLAVTFLGLAVAPAAAAKDGVVARLTEPLATGPSGGVRVAFVLEERATGDRFSALGIFVRARTTEGQVEVSATEISSMGGGEFEAEVPARREQIVDLAIGLAGVSSGPTGTRRSDAMFPLVNDPFPGSAERSSASQPDDDGWLVPLLYALLAVAGAFAVAAALRRAPRRAAMQR